MVAGYHAHGLGGTATFELYVRGLPPTRSFLVAAGLEQALEYLELAPFHAGRDCVPARSSQPSRHLRRVLRFLSRRFPVHRRRVGYSRGHAGVSAGALAARHGAAARGPDRRDGAALHGDVPDRRRQQSRPRRRSGTGPIGDRVRRPPRARRRSRRLRGSGRVHCRLRRDLERRGRPAIRHPALRDDGALMGHRVRVGTRSLRSLHGVVRKKGGAAARHLRHARCRAPHRRRGVSSVGGAPRQRRPGRAVARGPGDTRRRRPRGHTHPRERRARRTAHRRSRGGGRPNRRLRRRRRDQHWRRCPVAWRRLQAGRDRARGSAHRRRQVERGQADVAGTETGVATHRRRRRPR